MLKIIFNKNVLAYDSIVEAITGAAKYSGDEFFTIYGLILPTNRGGWNLLRALKQINKKADEEKLYDEKFIRRFFSDSSEVAGFVHLDWDNTLYAGWFQNKDRGVSAMQLLPESTSWSVIAKSDMQLTAAINVMDYSELSLDQVVRNLAETTDIRFGQLIAIKRDDFKAKEGKETLYLPVFSI